MSIGHRSGPVDFLWHGRGFNQFLHHGGQFAGLPTIFLVLDRPGLPAGGDRQLPALRLKHLAGAFVVYKTKLLYEMEAAEH